MILVYVIFLKKSLFLAAMNQYDSKLGRLF